MLPVPREGLNRPLEGTVLWHVGDRAGSHLKGGALHIFGHRDEDLDVVGGALLLVVALDLDQEFDLGYALGTLVEEGFSMMRSMENRGLTRTSSR